MLMTSVHPCLIRRIPQQLEPAFGRGNLPHTDITSEHRNTGKADTKWAEPPSEFLPFHSVCLMNHLWTRLLEIVETPIQSMQIMTSWKIVQLTGCTVFVQSPDSRIRVMQWRCRAGAEIRLCQIDERSVVLTETPHRMFWLRCLSELALADISLFYRQQGVHVTLEAAKNYCKWVFRQFASRLHKVVDLRRMRQLCGQSLQLSTDIVELAHRLAVMNIVPSKVSFADYNLVQRHATVLKQLRRDAPEMLRLFWVLCGQDDFPSQGEPLARIRQQLRKLQISGYVWTLMLKAGSRLLLIMREFYSSTSVDSVQDFLWILQRLQVEPGDQLGALRLIFSEFGHSQSRRTNFWPSFQAHKAAFAHLLSVTRHPKLDQQPTEEQLAMVVRWITSNAINGWDRAQRKLGWSWLLSSAQTWQEIQLRRTQASQVHWNVPFNTLDMGGLTLKALDNAADLIVHGHEMRNCVATYVRDCQSSSLLLVAVSRHDCKCVATGSYRIKNGVWVLTDAKGPANRELSQTLLRSMQCFVKHIPFAAELMAVAVDC